MSRSIKLRKGFDIRIRGAAKKIIAGTPGSASYGVRPVDFPGLTPKLDVRPGDSVRAGSPLFLDMLQPEIVFTSPVSGLVKSA